MGSALLNLGWGGSREALLQVLDKTGEGQQLQDSLVRTKLGAVQDARRAHHR